MRLSRVREVLDLGIDLISSSGLLGLLHSICSFFWCAVQVIPALMWGGTSSIGSGEAELTYFNGGLSYFLCPFDFVLLLQMVSISVSCYLCLS